MSFERPTIVEIVDRIEKSIEARLFGKSVLLRRALLRILARVFAGAIHLLYGYLQWIADQLFIQSCDTEFLERHSYMWGVTRKPGSFAVGSVFFVGTNPLIPLGTRIQRDDGVEYGTITAGGCGDYITVQAVEAGLSSNYEMPYPGAELQLVNSISSVESECHMFTNFEGGADPESDDDLRFRLLQRLQNPPMGGSPSDYVRWALEFPGVGRAWCYPIANGPGTVSTAIISNDPLDPVPSNQLLTDVQAYMEDKKPVTAQHTVVSITDAAGSPGSAKLSMNISITPNEASYQAQIIDNIETLLAPQTPGTNILISQLRSAISVSGVTDYTISSLTIDGSARDTNSDILIFGFTYVVVDTITF